MGVALRWAARRSREAGAAGREDLFRYLAEEVFDRLDPEGRLCWLIRASPDALTPELARDLGLPADVLEAGGGVRAAGEDPSLRRPLVPPADPRLPARAAAELRTEAERASLHERAGDSLAAAGQSAERD